MACHVSTARVDMERALISQSSEERNWKTSGAKGAQQPETEAYYKQVAIYGAYFQHQRRSVMADDGGIDVFF